MLDLTKHDIREIVHDYLSDNLTLSVNEVEECGSADRVGKTRKFKITLVLRHTILSEETFTI